MTIETLEHLMYQISELLLTPVLVIIALLFIYALIAFGRFTGLYWLRKKHAIQYLSQIHSGQQRFVKGYFVHNYFVDNPHCSSDELEVFALKKLENLRVVTRIAPMLGLIATMIPMGGALKSLANGNIQGISESLVIAFSAVILGLVTASITYWPASVKKRWFANELININKVKEATK